MLLGAVASSHARGAIWGSTHLLLAHRGLRSRRDRCHHFSRAHSNVNGEAQDGLADTQADRGSSGAKANRGERVAAGDDELGLHQWLWLEGWPWLPTAERQMLQLARRDALPFSLQHWFPAPLSSRPTP